jgi:hypothetical protein
MRPVTIAAALLALSAMPVFAQLTRGGTPLGPHTLRPHHMRCAELPVTQIPVPTLTIKGGHNPDGRYSFSRGDVVVLSAGTGMDVQPGRRYVVRRLDMPVGDFPKDGKSYGAVMTAGWLTVTASNEREALATVDFACDAMMPGDYLEPFTKATVPVTLAPLTEPNFDDRANILFGNDRRRNLANGDLVQIDRGTAQGVAVGARFGIYRDFHNDLPLVHVGDLVITEPDENTSQAVIVMARDAIYTGDIAVPRKTQ